jgi:acyl transferase domain-containing protein/NAD(P)-dependent dehydrogenase (short-subunit alcohol dehydrogenase family)/acyl-CoA thioesterase FadM
MAFFAMPYRVLFQDTMAYGSHHFLTNFKFQCEVREHFFFSQITDPYPDDKDLQDLVLFTQEGYSRNLAPVLVGERVGLLLTYEEPTRSSVRMCFRVVRQDGKPVCCGYQTMVCASRQSGGVIVAPGPLLYALAPLREPLRGPSFRERVLAGGSTLKAIFDDEVLRIGAAIARESGFRVVPDVLVPPALHGRRGGHGIVFLFPGQGSFEPALFQKVCQLDPSSSSLLEEADALTRRLLGAGVLALCQGKGDEAEAALRQCPDLVQIAAYLTSVLCARYLVASGVTPHLLLGHSAGELSALAAGGAYDLTTGVELICHRIRALHGLRSPGGAMLALNCDARKARALVDAAAAGSLEIAVINHDEQTVVSGTTEDLKRLSAVLAAQQVTGVPLKSRYPFHSQLLREAVGLFAADLKTLAFKPLTTPVYSPLGRGLYARQPDLPAVLPGHFVQQLVFPEALEDAYAFGGRTYIECGGGRALTGLAQRIFRDWPDVTLHALSVEGKPVDLAQLAEQLVKKAAPPVVVTPEATRKHAAPVPSVPKTEPPVPMPIAIVSLGCVLPGAANPDALWSNLLSGKSGIVDVAQLDPTVAADFRCERPVRADKTYSLLSGRADAGDGGAAARHYTPEEWGRLPAVGRFLATAAVQCLSGLKTPLPSVERICCVLGSTGDGSADYDELLLLAAAEEAIRAGGAPEAAKDQFCHTLEKVLGRNLDGAGERLPQRTYAAVAQRLLGDGVKVLAVDAACASSLYAIDLGLRALRDGQCDVAVCGGVFAPGVANTCLFAQFQGLSATGSRPLDASADGVVFGEGAALLVLKRLPDALAAGDPIHAVIRGVGTSSDGKSPSVMEPRKEGQILAMRRAAARYGVSPATVQYIDAHATGTPVGDAVEFASLCEAVGPRPPGQPPIRLGSLKALLGHTGWAAGSASVIALCKGLQHQTFPPQPNFTSPNLHFGLERSPFTIGTEPTPWPSNIDGLPRRAGVNGFGFGGCDAHLILEEFQPDYHRAVCASAAAPPPPGEGVAIIAFTALFPSNRDSTTRGRPWLFSPAEVRLPAKVRILPDVADHMDRSHILAVRAAAETALTMSRGWDSLFTHTDYRPETGILVGFAGKTRRGIDASLRVYFDHLLRRLGEVQPTHAADRRLFERVRDDFAVAIRRITPSGPYTLPGLMPNVMAGRVANAFHLTGPNMVLDADNASLYETLREAERLIRFGECKVVLAGAISSCAGPDVDRVLQACGQPDPRPTGEAAIVLALVSPAVAHVVGLPVLGYLSFEPDVSHVPPSQGQVYRVGTEAPVQLQGAEGAVELATAIDLIQHHGGSATVEWADPAHGRTFSITLTRDKVAPPHPEVPRKAPSVNPIRPPAAAAPVPEKLPEEVASLLAVPVRWTTPKWMPEALAPTVQPWSAEDVPVLVLTDQPVWALTPAVRAILDRLRYRLVCPAAVAPPGAIGIDLTSTATVDQTLRRLDDVPYDAMLVLKNLEGGDVLETVTGSGQITGGLIDLMFAVARHAYPRLEKGEVGIGAICLHGVLANSTLHPYTGLVSGFLRSLSRELPAAICKQVNTPDGELAGGLTWLADEWSQGKPPAPTEVSYLGGKRHACSLVELKKPAVGAPLLTPESVVLAAGGARGITAVLVEALLRRFGCTLVILGRTDPDAVPADLMALDDEAFERFEPEYYRRELARGAGVRMPELKVRYESYRSAREAAANLRLLRSLPGRVIYLRADVTDEAAVDAALRQVAQECGRLDMVLDGAGIQSSKVLARKKIEEFRAILTTKLGGLGNLMRGCRRHFPGRRIHFHPITSAFSQMGNAGQEDYGAANLGMDRVAQYLAAGPGPWDASSLGWLGWFRVGMTRGSEYATLAILRRLRPIPRAEGGALFETFLSGRPVAATMHLMSELEASAFQLTIMDGGATPPAQPIPLERTWTLAPDTHPFLRDHLLNGVPTMPGAFAVELAVRTVRELRPALHIKHLATVSIERFIKFPEGRPFVLRAVSEVLEETPEFARIGLRFLSDFVHANGKVLQKDLVHFSAELLLTSEPQKVAGHAPLSAVREGWQLPDPYLHPAGPLLMDGLFRSLEDIQISPTHCTAVYRPRPLPAPPAIADAFIPFVLLDAVWRFSAVRREEDGTAILCVPLRCGRLDILPGVSHATLANQECALTCSAPRLEGEHILVDWAEAADSSGRVIFAVKDIVGRIYGRVPAQAEPLVATAPTNGATHGAGEPSGPKPTQASHPHQARPIDGKVALVTGSGRGIGKVIVQRLADLGAQVVVNSFHSRDQGERTTAEILARGGKAVHLWGSVANPSHLQRIFSEIERRFDGLDYFISNASAGVFAPLIEVTPEHWDRCFRTNVVALHQGALLAAPLMRRRGGGKILALSSVGAQLCFDYFGCVGPVKAAVEALVRYLAVELAADGIQVNTVTAGPVKGDLLDSFPGRPRWERLVPRQRMITEDESAEPVLFLLTHDGMNGASLLVDAAGSLRLCEPVS